MPKMIQEPVEGRGFVDVAYFSALEAEAMLCAWEAVLEWRFDEDNAGRRPDGVEEAFERFGTVAIRHHVKELSTWLLGVYGAGIELTGDPDAWEGHAYDWDVIPACLAVGRVWAPEGGAISEPVAGKLEDVARLVLASLTSEEAALVG